MKKIPIIVLILFVFIVSIFGSFISSLDGCAEGSIDYFEAEINIDDSGNMNVLEKWTYSYNNGDYAKYRDIDVKKYNIDNPIAQSYDDTATFSLPNNDLLEAVKVKKDGVYLPTLKISENRDYNDNYAYIGISGERDERGEIIQTEPYSPTGTSLFIYVPSVFTKMEFEYNYIINGATTIYDDTASLNWRLFEYNEWDIKSGKVTINVPNNVNGIDSLRCFARGAKKDGKVTIVDANTITLEFGKISSDATLEFRVLSPINLYPNALSKNKVNEYVYEDIMEFEKRQADSDNLRITIANILTIASVGLVVLMGFITYYVYNKYDKEYKASFEGKYYRELPSDITPVEMSYLYYFGKINDEDVSATLLDLIRRGYISLDTREENVTKKDPDFLLILNSNADFNELLPHERHLIKWFFGSIGNGSEVSIKQIENYPKVVKNAEKFNQDSKTFVRLAIEQGKKHNYIERNGFKDGAISFVLIPLLFVIACFVLSSMFTLEIPFATISSISVLVLYLLYYASIKRRTIEGNEEFVKWKAFKQFLLDFSHMEDNPIPGVVIWEHYLVYATSLKIADEVMEQLKVKLPMTTEELNSATYMGMGYRYNGFYYGYTLGRINSSFKTAKQTGIQTIATYNAQKVSSSGRGGGFSGGSSFGGGGGGGRSR